MYSENELKLVRAHSQRYNLLRDLCSRTCFSNVNTQFVLSYVFKNREAYDNVNPSDALAYLASMNEDLKKCYEVVKKNRERVKEFERARGSIRRETQPFYINRTGMEREKFLRIEDEICKEYEQKLKDNLDISVHLYYGAETSGVSKVYNFTYEHLNAVLEQNIIPFIEPSENAVSSDVHDYSFKDVKAKITPALRYKVLQRDGFRCVFCGASAKDDVILEVDFVKSAEEGGRAEAGNLRTLCNRCIKGVKMKSCLDERGKMTLELRNKILRRDGFRCVLCGASEKDGAKLHVDHIMPVSKGGKTTESNLRTLCERCNFGKHDRYDPDGLN